MAGCFCLLWDGERRFYACYKEKVEKYGETFDEIKKDWNCVKPVSTHCYPPS
jgi:hypothetical protein